MTDLKKLLLAGTAIVAIGGVSAPALAATQTVATDAQWSSSATHDGSDITEADAGDDVSFTDDATLTIVNDGTADDGGGVDDFTLGEVTDVTGKTGNIVVTTDAAGGAVLTVDITSVDIAGDFTITGVDGDDADIAVTLAEASTIGGDLTITTDETDAAGTFDLTAEGGLTVTGATTVTGSGLGTSTLTTQGASTFTGGVTLDDDTGLASLVVHVATDGTSFTVAGDIDGDTAGEGTVQVYDDDPTTEDLVTFTGDLGSEAGLLELIIGDAVGDFGANVKFTGDVTAADVTIGAADVDGEDITADFDGDVTGDVTVVADAAVASEVNVSFAGDVDGAIVITDVQDAFGVVTLTFDGTSAQTVTGTVTPTNQEGLVTVSGSDVTFEDDIGAAGNGLALFTVSEGGKATLEGDLFTDSTDQTEAAGIDVDGTLVLTNSAANGVNVLEDAGDIDFDGTVTVNGDTTNATIVATTGDVYIDGVFSTAIGTAAATTTVTSGTATLIGGTSNTTVRVGNQLVLGSDATFGSAAGKTTTLLAVKSDTFDQTALETSVVDANGQDVLVNDDSVLKLGVSGAFDKGDTVMFFEGAGGGTDLEAELDAGDIKFLNNGLIRLSSTDNTGADQIEAVVSFRDAADVFSSKSYSGAANALLALPSTTTGELATVRGLLTNSATSSASAEEVSESVSPSVDGGATHTALTNVSNSANGLIGTRLASVRDASGETGMAAGNLTHGLKMWAQVFGTTGEQDERDGVSGFDVDTYGVTVGIDTQTLAEDWVWGLAFTYADTEVESNGVNSTDTEIDTYQIALYADYKWDAQTYVNGVVGYGFNDADQTRHNVGTIGLTANSDFDSDQFFAKLETGRDYELRNGTTLTPFALANFSYIDTEGYTETGAGGANLEVDTDDQYIFELGLGLEASWLHELEDGSYLKPSLVAGYRYDLADDEVEATSTFTGGGVAFKTEGFDPQNHTFRLGAGLAFYTTANWELSANYDYELKEDYDAHNGYLRAAYRF
jgi:autotransporter family porin